MYQPLAISGKPYALVEQKPADKFEKYKKQLKPVVEWKKHQADLQERGMEIPSNGVKWNAFQVPASIAFVLDKIKIHPLFSISSQG